MTVEKNICLWTDARLECYQYVISGLCSWKKQIKIKTKSCGCECVAVNNSYWSVMD